MNKKIVIYFIATSCVVLFILSRAFSADEDMKNLKEFYGEKAVITCFNCHGEEDGFNAYGKAYKEAGRNIEAVKKIDTQDSDEDGVSNAEEFKAGTNPGIVENQ